MYTTHLTGKLTTLAGRYAKTLFELAQNQARVKEVLKEFSTFLRILEEHQELKSAIRNQALTQDEQVSILQALMERLSSSPLFQQFLILLLENRRFSLLQDIYSLYCQLYDNQESIRHVEVQSAFPLTEAQQKKLESILLEKIKGKLEIKFSLDPHLLGGIFIRLGNQVIDLSFLTQLQHLTNTMKGHA